MVARVVSHSDASPPLSMGNHKRFMLHLIRPIQLTNYDLLDFQLSNQRLNS